MMSMRTLVLVTEYTEIFLDECRFGEGVVVDFADIVPEPDPGSFPSHENGSS